MQHRHLLPNELDLLLDGEAGFGVAQLRAHVDECGACQSRLADARVVVDALEDLPHFAPKLRFADRVMARVQVIEPWHAAVLDTLGRLVPRSAPLRIVAAATASVVATTLSAGAVWLALHADAAVYGFGLAADRIRAGLVSSVVALVGDALGQPGVDAIRSSSLSGLALGAGLVLAAAGGATLGLRALASASRRIRE
ncbi:MAG: hypothetical protein ACHQQ3_05250 [Gemmatimonadales bacterium]